MNLFGEPETSKSNNRGRPSLKLSEEIQCVIRSAIRGGMSRDAIGEALGIDPKTIRKYFSGRGTSADGELERASVRVRKMGSELHRIAEEMQAALDRDREA